MNPEELVWGTAAYLLSSLSLGLASWALVEKVLPRPARLGLRLAAVFALQLALCSLLVQTLGLCGLLEAGWYLGASLLPGIAVLGLQREKRPLAAFLRALRRLFRLWVGAPAWGLGWIGALFLLYLARRFFFLPRDVDALTLHGPLIVEWIESGRVALASFWNYPQCWEYQFVPAFLLLRSEVLVAIPALLAVIALALAVRELAARLALGGRTGHLLALLVALMPIVWREALKSDPVFAFALLLGILAVDRAARRLAGGFWLLQLAIFLVLGTKPSGFIYAGVLAAAYLAALYLTRGRRPPTESKRAASWLAGAAAVMMLQGSAAAVQLRNFVASGNPFHPLRFEILGRTLFEGPVDLGGTSILENSGNGEVWRQFLSGGRLMVGEEWPLLPLLLAAALLWVLVAACRRLATGRRWERSAALGLALPPVALLLWILFLATPWSSGRSLGAFQYAGSGSSLRYAIAPLALTFLSAAALARRFLGRRTLYLVLLAAFPLLIWGRWSHLQAFGQPRFFLGALLAVLLLAGLDRIARHRRFLAAAGERAKIATTLALALLLLLACALSAEQMREKFWVRPYKPIWRQVYDHLPPGARIGISDPRAANRYFLYGRRLGNMLIPVDLDAGGSSAIPPDVDYVYVATRGEGHEQPVDTLTRQGWQVLARSEDQRGTLLGRQP